MRYNDIRRKTRSVAVGQYRIGARAPIAIQSMTNTKTEDVEATVAQILALESVGCEIIRCAVPTMEAAEALREIKKQIHIPLVADIHFDYKLAIAAIEASSPALTVVDISEDINSSASACSKFSSYFTHESFAASSVSP